MRGLLTLPRSRTATPRPTCHSSGRGIACLNPSRKYSDGIANSPTNHRHARSRHSSRHRRSDAGRPTLQRTAGDPSALRGVAGAAGAFRPPPPQGRDFGSPAARRLTGQYRQSLGARRRRAAAHRVCEGHADQDHCSRCAAHPLGSRIATGQARDHDGWQSAFAVVTTISVATQGFCGMTSQHASSTP